jgi:hypothetical protein
MEHYFSLQRITHDIMKLQVGLLYLDRKYLQVGQEILWGLHCLNPIC